MMILSLCPSFDLLLQENALSKESTKYLKKRLRIKVVGLTTPRDNTPVGAERDKSIWIRSTASASEVVAFGWSDTWNVSFQYVQGRYMRPATPEDVENAIQWDAETVKALMGSGCLYVVRAAVKKIVCVKKESTDSEVKSLMGTLCVF